MPIYFLEVEIINFFFNKYLLLMKFLRYYVFRAYYDSMTQKRNWTKSTNNLLPPFLIISKIDILGSFN